MHAWPTSYSFTLTFKNYNHNQYTFYSTFKTHFTFQQSQDLCVLITTTKLTLKDLFMSLYSMFLWIPVLLSLCYQDSFILQTPMKYPRLGPFFFTFHPYSYCQMHHTCQMTICKTNQHELFFSPSTLDQKKLDKLLLH